MTTCPIDHPGKILRENILKDLGFSQEEASQEMNLKLQERNYLSKVLKELKPITARLALQLEELSGGPSAESWLRMQTQYDLQQAQEVLALEPYLATHCVSLIAAVGTNGVIGHAGKMPWHLPGDLAHFRKLTLDKTVIMGRKTYESIGKALDHRQNLVLSREPALKLPDAEVVTGLLEVLKRVKAWEIMVIGGAEVYRAFFPYATRLYFTEVEGDFPGDTFFPAYDSEEWKQVTASEWHTASDVRRYRYAVYDR
jgi:dihydrofolate reductase